jgi:hypothetical protein
MKGDAPARTYTVAGDVILENLKLNARMLSEKFVRHRHFIVSQLPPSGIDIPASDQSGTTGQR